jgi:LacI family transcriptional regulator
VPEKRTVVNLRTVAERVGLAPCSVSAVLNNTPASLAIPQHTKDRVFRAAAKLNYRPNLSARSLRTKRTHLIAVISDNFGREQVAHVVAGMERRLRRRGYLLALGALDRPSEWVSLSVQLNQRGIEGIIAVGAKLPPDLDLPVALVDLGCVNPGNSVGEKASGRLTELGESAAEALVARIEGRLDNKIESSTEAKISAKMETNASARRAPQGTKIPPGLARAYFALPVPPVNDQLRRPSEQP